MKCYLIFCYGPRPDGGMNDATGMVDDLQAFVPGRAYDFDALDMQAGNIYTWDWDEKRWMETGTILDLDDREI